MPLLPFGLGRATMAVLLVTAALLAHAAEPYPSKPIHIVVPFAAGGAVDKVARIVGAQLSEQVGTPVIVDNKPGANANLGADYVAKAAPDGYTLLLGANGLATNPTLYKDLGFDPLRDFAPVAFVGYAPLVLVVPAASPARSLQDLLAMARRNPDALTYGSSGNGGSGHLASELLKSTAHVSAMHVPYKGGAPALTDLIGGRLSFMLINPLEAVPHVNGNTLRALAVSSDKRIALLPDVPTFAEAGVPGFEASVWWGFVAPARTPKEVVDRLSTELVRAMRDAGVRDKLSSLGAVIDPQPAPAFGTFLKSETEKWAGVIRSGGIRAD